MAADLARKASEDDRGWHERSHPLGRGAVGDTAPSAAGGVQPPPEQRNAACSPAVKGFEGAWPDVERGKSDVGEMAGGGTIAEGSLGRWLGCPGKPPENGGGEGLGHAT